MDLTAFLIGVTVGLAIGVASWFAARAKHARESAASGAEIARLRTGLDSERRAATEKLALLDEAQKKLKDAFAALSAEALRQSNETFLQLARASLGQFQTQATMDLDSRQKSIDESLARIDVQLKDVEKQRVDAYHALTQQVASVAKGQQGLQTETGRLQTETGRLVQSLRSPNIRGLWGEMQLRKVVELAGMVEYCDFVEKDSVMTEEGGRRTPDLVVRLPGDRQIVVDSKVPTDAFMQAVDAPDEATRESKVKDHARQVKAHIDGLSRKAYWDQFQPTPEFVFMFLPAETLLSTALQHDPGLLEYGVTKRVIPATPLTLIALLRAVAYGWQQDKIAKNAEEISRLGRELYDRINTVAKHFGAVGRNLREAMDAFNKAVGSLEGRLLVTARKFKDLGAGAGDDVPELEPVDVTPRDTRAPELTGLFEDQTVGGEVVKDN